MVVGVPEAPVGGETLVSSSCSSKRLVKVIDRHVGLAIRHAQDPECRGVVVSSELDDRDCQVSSYLALIERHSYCRVDGAVNDHISVATLSECRLCQTTPWMNDDAISNSSQPIGERIDLGPANVESGVVLTDE
jgi:hypothetical protein